MRLAIGQLLLHLVEGILAAKLVDYLETSGGRGTSMWNTLLFLRERFSGCSEPLRLGRREPPAWLGICLVVLTCAYSNFKSFMWKRIVEKLLPIPDTVT
jgi:hypothetical protein